MGKKSKRNRNKSSVDDSALSSRAPPNLRQEQEVETLENLKYEDPFVEEEYDDEDEWSDEEENNSEGEGMNDDDENAEIVQAWNPFASGKEKLEMDPSAYKMYHALTAEWPSLSFDFVRDNLGSVRTRFPHSLICVAGSQAPQESQNQLTVMKMSDLSKMKHETDDDILGEEFNPDSNDKNDDDSEDSDDEIEMEPVMEHYSVPHAGGVNRVRAMPQQSSIVATWSETGNVHLFDIQSILDRFEVSRGKQTTPGSMPTKPIFTYKNHSTEGYAMDWSTKEEGSLATGDCNGGIHLWKQGSGGSFSVTPSYEANEKQGVDQNRSVEDLQWSPTESTVFASAECGGYVRIFDVRAPHKSMLNHKIHSNGADVNVLSWNKLVSNLLATGGDDGALSVWDLRHFSGDTIKPLARFTPHRTALCSVEWHPTDESMLAVTDDTGAYVYDLSVEEDDVKYDSNNLDNIPPQLLFVHSGSEQFKEVHWHPQISSCLMTTALSGYSVFIPSNL